MNKTSLFTNFYKIYLSIFSNFFITRNRPTTWTTFSTLFTICSVSTPLAPSPPRMLSLVPKQSVRGLHEFRLGVASGLDLMLDEEEGGGRLGLLVPTGVSRELEISASFPPTLVQVTEVGRGAGVSGFFWVLRVLSRKLLRRGDFLLCLFVARSVSQTMSGSWLLLPLTCLCGLMRSGIGALSSSLETATTLFSE